ncbi:MAG: hypothetical protein ACM31E_04235 [Fibrobacterota bacterium]|nr:hypothetical protein [Chitinispirillaceae bacterium]
MRTRIFLSGPVQVKYADHKSNKKNLSLWEIPFKYTITGPQAIYVELLAKVRWRADLAAYREKPEEEATHCEVTIMPGRTSTADYSAIGSATIDDDGSVTYSGSGTIPSPYSDESNPTNAVMYWAQFLPGDTTTLKVWAKVLVYPAYNAIYKGKDSRTVEQPIALPDKLVITKEAYQPSAVISLDEMILAGSMPFVNKLTFDADYTIAKGQCGPLVLKGSDGSSEHLLSWEQCTPKFPPLKNGRL